MELPTITNYGEYSSDNYGANSLRVSMDNFDLWYSYKTIIAYRDAQDGFVMRQNDWSTTTGKHMNWLDPDHSKRIESGQFQAKLQAMLERHSK